MSDQDERDAILAVIQAETDAYFRRDYDAWEKCWHDGPETRRVQTHVGTGVTVVKGSNIRIQMQRLLTEGIDWQSPAEIRREDFNVVISPEMAWVSYNQRSETSNIPREMVGHYHEVKILQKFDGFWKITCLIGTQMRIDRDRAPMVEVDAELRIIWTNEAAQKQLPENPALSQRVDRLQATDPKFRAELLDAVAWISKIRDRYTPCIGEGKAAHAITLGQDAVARAVALGQDDAGLAHICWVILRDGKLLVTFDDTNRLDRQLSIAAEVYGLSENQEKLARHLVDGCDLSVAAAELGISPNTAKTHLQRIYDKTGVRAQSALVRLLLNADWRGV